MWPQWVRSATALLGWAVMAGLAACGGGGDTAPAQSNDGRAAIGSAGGTVLAADGARVAFPPKALASTVNVQIVKDGTGSPPLPPVATPASAVYAITPHGGDFAVHAEVSIPVERAVALNEQLVMVTAEPGETRWRVLSAARYQNGEMRAPVMRFSFFQVIALQNVRLPKLMTQVNRVTNLDYPGATVVSADYEFARSGGFSQYTSPSGDTPWFDVVARLEHPPFTVAGVPFRAGVTTRYCKPLDLSANGSRWTITHEGTPITPGISHLSMQFAVPAQWPATLAQASATGFVEDQFNTRDPAGSGLGVAHFYGAGGTSTDFSEARRDQRTRQPAWIDRYALPTAGNDGADDTYHWYGRVNFTAQANGRVRIDAVVDTDCGLAVEAAPLSFRLALSDLWLLGTEPVDVTAIGALWGWPFEIDFTRFSSVDERVTLRRWEYSADGQSWGDLPAGVTIEAPSLFSDSNLFALKVDAAGFEHAGFYRSWTCGYSGTGADRVEGCMPSAAVQVTVANNPPAAALSEPKTQTVLAGETATVTGYVDGYYASQYWEMRTFADAFLGRPWVNLGPGTTSGFGLQTITTPPLPLADQPYYVRLVSTGPLGTSISEAATVAVTDRLVPPRLTAQPTSQRVEQGSSFALAVTAEGPGPFSYQWRRNGVNLLTSGPIYDSLSHGAMGGDYDVVVSNRAGAVTSAVATVTIVPRGGLQPPAIAQQPGSLTVREGAAANFSVAANGSAPLSYAWFKNGSGTAVATTPTLAFASVTQADAGSYTVRVANDNGSVTSSAATLTVTPPAPVLVAPTILTPPSATAVVPGTTATFVVGTSGSGPLSYQWRFNGVDIAGATGPSLSIPFVSLVNAGSYAVEVRNSVGFAVSNAVPLVVIGAPVIVQQPDNASAAEGGSASFTVAASGDTLRYQWLRNGLPLTDATAASYTTPALSSADHGAAYSVAVYNGAGLLFSRTAVLTVSAPALAAYESFDYPLGDLLQGKNGGTGWASAWAVTLDSGSALSAPEQGGLIGTGLRYTDSMGNELVTRGGAWQTDAGIAAGIARRATTAGFGAPGSTRWISFLVKQAAVSAPANVAAVTLGVDASAGPLRTMAGISDDASALVGGLFNRTSNGSIPGLVPGAVAMVLVRVDFGISGAYDDSMSLWINPPLDTAAALGTPMATFPSANFADAINGVSLLWGYSRSFTFDELRLGSTRASVSPYTPPSGSGTAVFAADFGSLPAEFAPGSATVESSQGYAALPIGGGATWGPQMLRSASGNVVTLTLSGLPAHQWLSLDFLFAAIDSLDGAGTYPAGDYFRITVDGADVFREAFENSGAGPQTYLPPPGVTLARKVDLGFTGPGSYYTDSGYWLGGEPALQRIPHSASSVTITWRIEGAGAQDINDESWGMSRLRVRVGP